MRAFPPAGSAGRTRSPEKERCIMGSYVFLHIAKHLFCFTLRVVFMCGSGLIFYPVPHAPCPAPLSNLLAVSPGPGDRPGADRCDGLFVPEQPLTSVAAGNRPIEAVMDSGVSPINPRTLSNNSRQSLLRSTRMTTKSRSVLTCNSP